MPEDVASTPPDNETPPDASPLRVLIVDDDPAIGQTFRDVLVDQGFLASSVQSGREALQTLMLQGFDVLVVDLRMSEMDGIVFLQEALRIWPWLGVVIVSAYISRDVPEQAARLGISRMLEKPVDIEDFVRSIRGAAEDKHNVTSDIPESAALTLMRDHLKLLAGVNLGSLTGETLSRALRDFGNSIAKFVPSDVVGVLIEEENGEPVLIMTPRAGISTAFVESVKVDILSRFKALSGRRVDEGRLRISAEGASPLDTTSAPAAAGHTLAVPLLIEGEVHGLLTLATISPEGYTPADVSLLYHTTNHISAVFTALRKMHGLATRDPLTGIYNRIRLEEELDRAWLTRRRYGSPMGVVVADVDNFKSVNDAYGHAVGDEVIRDFAQVIMSAARSTDIVARYGGDEFVAILPVAAEDDARAFAERILHAARDHLFCRHTHGLKLTVSIGVATSDNPTAPTTSAALMSQADRALYTAKRAGRNRICVWPGSAFLPGEDSESAHETVDDLDLKPEKPGTPHIVVVEDEEPIRRLVKLMLERENYVVEAYETAAESLAYIKDNPGICDILVTDIGLPGISGIDLLHEVSDIDPSIVSVVMTGHATVDNAVKCLREGAYDFIQKPIEQMHLLALLRRALEYHELKIENDRYQKHLENMVRDRSAKLAASLQDVQASYEFTLDALVRMLDAREHHTGRHSKRVRELSTRLAREIGVGVDTQEIIARGAFLHDIGKIAVPDKILLKPAPLTKEEWVLMKEHAQTGYNIIKTSAFLKESAEIVLQHHEHWDGSGYPEGLRGTEICLGARVFAVVDAYDAMRGHRGYRSALSRNEAEREIIRAKGKQFDPDMVDAFVRCLDDLEEIIADIED